MATKKNHPTMPAPPRALNTPARVRVQLGTVYRALHCGLISPQRGMAMRAVLQSMLSDMRGQERLHIEDSIQPITSVVVTISDDAVREEIQRMNSEIMDAPKIGEE